MSKAHKWTIEEKEYLKSIVKGRHYKEIVELMNQKFEYQFRESQIKGAIARDKLTTGLTGAFPKGNIPFNKGLKGVCAKGCEKTWFKKGNMPSNHRKVGSERITKDGYVEIKTEEPKTWRMKHNVIYEQKYGPIPKGYSVIFADGDKRNLDIDNLILVSRKELLVMNRNKLIQNNKALTQTGLLIAKVMLKASEVKKKK